MEEEIRKKAAEEEERLRILREPSETMIEEQEIFDRLQELLFMSPEEESEIIQEQRNNARDR